MKPPLTDERLAVLRRTCNLDGERRVLLDHIDWLNAEVEKWQTRCTDASEIGTKYATEIERVKAQRNELLEAASGALNHLAGVPTKFSERVRIAVIDRLRCALAEPDAAAGGE